MIRKVYEIVKRAVLKAGATPLGKAVEHAAVAAGALGITMLFTAYLKGNLDLDAVSTAGVAVGTAFVAGVRAYLKKKTYPES